MIKKKEYLWTFLVFFIFVFGILLTTGTITCGWHLVDDHEYTEYEIFMNKPDENLFTCIRDVLKVDFTSRFRPLYYILRVSLTCVFGSNLVAWSVLKAVETVLALYFLYLFARQLGCNYFFAAIFSLVNMVGPQSVVWWKLGPQECTGLMFFAMGMYFLNIWLNERKKMAKYGSLLFFFMMSLYKESFLIMISFVMIYLVYYHCRSEKFSISLLVRAIGKELDMHLILGVILVVELLIIVFFVGTNDVSYIGFDAEFTLSQYINVWRYVGETYLIWYIRFGALALLFLLAYIREWKKMMPWFLLGIVVMIPQMILYNKTSLEERYSIPWSFGFALFFVMPVAVTGLKRSVRKLLYACLLVALLVCHMKVLVEEAEYYSYRGISVTSVLNKVYESVDENTKVLSAYSPYAESDYTVSYWLLQRGFNQVYHWNESDKTCTVKVGENRGITGQIDEMDIILFYNPKDRHYCYVPSIDLNEYECVDYGTLTMAFRK